jgi:hypothetical protein
MILCIFFAGIANRTRSPLGRRLFRYVRASLQLVNVEVTLCAGCGSCVLSVTYALSMSAMQPLSICPHPVTRRSPALYRTALNTSRTYQYVLAIPFVLLCPSPPLCPTIYLLLPLCSSSLPLPLPQTCLP